VFFTFRSKRHPRILRLLVTAVSLVVLQIFHATEAKSDSESEQFFETEIRPLLSEHCIRCHGPDKQSGGLRLDSPEFLEKGGDSGAAIVPGRSDESRFIQAVRYDGDLQMPPDNRLTEKQVAVLDHWVRSGAIWPATSSTISSTSEDPARHHWAFQPVQTPPVPVGSLVDRAAAPIDAFILDRLQREGLSLSPDASRAALIRRVSYVLTGLPPAREDVAAFVNDPDPRAYENLIERLLRSPAYGEQWARHWLDVARYSDTKGYVYAREERFWVHAWAYRDWVVQALNSDLPYDRFLLLQIAADQVPDRAEGDLAAMGFLTLGRRFLGVTRDIIDDRIDVVTRGTMALTVGCARCHDHKYDPIPTADYYSLYGVFNSSREKFVSLQSGGTADAAFDKELAARTEKLRTFLQTSREETAARVRSRVGEYLKAQTELEKYPEEGFDQILQKTDLLPAFVRRWQTWLRDAELRADPVFLPWHVFVKLPPSSFTQDAQEQTRLLQQQPSGSINPLVAAVFSSPPTSFDDVINRYGELLAGIEQQWQTLRREAADNHSSPPVQLSDPAAEQIRNILYGAGSPCEVPDEPIVHTETDFDSGTCTELWKLQSEVDRWIINSPVQAAYALTLEDREVPRSARIFKRGNPAMKGDEVPRQFLKLLSGPDRQPFQQGSGRLELAQAIIDPANPLTARVIVNRVWARCFGTGLVSTPGDFGVRADPPSHPELLDWLTSRFIQDGWSLKKLQRLILLSSTFRQSSAGPADPGTLQRALTADPGNRLLWRMNVHRLSFEELRDSLLAAGGTLDRTSGGKATDLFKAPWPVRRTLYGLVDRQFLPGTLRMFDFANPDLHIPQRSETTVPQQSLFLMNHPIALEQARALVKEVASETASIRSQADANTASETVSQIRRMFEKVLQREPTTAELSDALQLVTTSDAVADQALPTATEWTYGYGAFDEATGKTTAFAPLPHFTGTAWQGGTAFPDSTLGWVQLTAAGGHPGNDRSHAIIRRWTAPEAMTIQVSSEFRHEPAAGDGVRAFVVSSRSGRLQSATVHQQTVPLNVETLTVDRGETIDFVVDINEVLNSDQFLWRIQIQPREATGETRSWDSEKDFTVNTTLRLTPMEQLAQVLFCSNEFLFVD
jgi:hypothetical protein